MPAKQIEAVLLENREAATNIHRLQVITLSPLEAPEPGQFFMVKPGKGTDPLLPRPLSFLRVQNAEQGNLILDFLFEVRGKGTAALAAAGKGAAISLTGPLGRGWRLDSLPELVILAGGGIGAVPLYSAALALAARQNPPELRFIYGAKTAEQLPLEIELARVSPHALLCTEDGCKGERGMVTDLLQKELNALSEPSRALVLACGPRPMLKAVAAMTSSRGVPCQVSLEARMACGLGACLTCTVKGKHGRNLRVCKEGPVFSADEIDWEALDDSA